METTAKDAKNDDVNHNDPKYIRKSKYAIIHIRLQRRAVNELLKISTK